MAGVWTDEMDAALILRRVTQRLTWRSVAPIGGMNEKKCQARLRMLQAGRPEVAGAPVAAPAEPDDRDGLDWLVAKKRLTHKQGLAGYDYRKLFRNAREGGAIKSNFGMECGGGSHGGGLPTGGSFGDAAASLDLYVMRWITLGGQRDLLTVMDGVCGIGHTVRALAGGNQVRAAQLEQALRIALDLIVLSSEAKAKALAARTKAA